MIIKELTKKEISKIYLIGKKEFYGEDWFSKKFLYDSLRRKCVSFIALEKNKIVGTIMVDVLDKPKAWIFYFIVDKKYRERGIGTRLIKEIEKNLPKGYNVILTDFEKRDHSARKFYKRQGFKEVAKIKSWFGLKHYGLIYEKILKN